jgi:hypothetical protein
MKTFNNVLAAIPTVLFVVACSGQIKNAKIVRVNIDGNCDLCQKTIESAAFIKKTADAEWDKDKKTAVLTFDSTKTNSDEVLKRIAYAGYDNEKYLAPDLVYNKLPGCCKYDRVRKQKSIQGVSKKEVVEKETTNEQIAQTNQFSAVFESYFALKNALITSDKNQTSMKATQLAKVFSEVDMMKLDHKQHEVWMNVYKDLITKSEAVAKSKNIEDQRHHFMGLSDGMYQLAKISKIETPVYFQNCPMYNYGKGANWLSEESAIKNPYYGSKMLSCGITKETIK